MDRQPQSGGVIRVASVLITIALVLVVGGGALYTIISITGPFGDPATVGMDVFVRPDEIASLPRTATLADAIPVRVEVGELSGKQRVGLVGTFIPAVAFGAITLLLLRRIVRTAGEGHPFSSANVRRLNVLGVLLIVGDPIGAYLIQFFSGMFVDELGLSTTIGWSILSAYQLVGIFMLVIAQVFAHGVRLREDVEGTV